METARARYGHILAAITATPWAIQAEKLAAIAEFIALKAAGGHVTAAEVAAVVGAARQGQPGEAGGGVMVIPVLGTLVQRANLMSEYSGGTTVQALTRSLREALADSSVSAILFDVDSPGGSVSGIEELASEIHAGRKSKPIVAVANSLMASAAYWIGSAATEVWVTPSGEVGGIGVLAAHEDVSGALDKQGVKISLVSAGRHKVEGNPYEPLGDEARTAIQKRVDEYYDAFVTAVARHRGTTPPAVRDGYGQGRVVGAREAVRVGLADRIGTFDAALSRAAELARQASRERARAGARARALDLAVLGIREERAGVGAPARPVATVPTDGAGTGRSGGQPRTETNLEG